MTARVRPFGRLAIWIVLAFVLTALTVLEALAATALVPLARRDPNVRPLAFEANRGQADSQVKFLARGAGYTVFLTPTEAVVSLGAGRSERAVVRVKPLGASGAARLVADGELPGVVNYAGRSPGASPVSAPTYARVRYVDVYPGIDLVYYGRRRELEYDFLLAPGADPDRIALAFDGAERLEIDASGDLILHTAAGTFRQRRPVVYQEIDGARRSVAGDYAVDGPGRVRFRLGAYDRTRPLVIDPVLEYSTYLGGTDVEGEVPGAGIAVDGAGNVYVTGTTRSVDFPTTSGANQTPGGGSDIFVTKFSPAGTVLYSTYLGGPCDESVRAIAVDPAGNAYVTGRVDQVNCYVATPGALVAKLGPTGALLYSTVLGGALVEMSGGVAIAVDSVGHAYVTGTTDSATFPTTPGALRREKCTDFWPVGSSDGFVAKLSANGSSLIYSTFLCGSGDDVPADIAVDAAGNAYIAGTTGSHDFPTVNPLQPAAGNSGGIDGVTGFVSKLAPDGSHLVYSTYLGGATRDLIHGLALDGGANVYVTGETQSLDFPTTPGVLQEHGPTNVGNMICGYHLCYLGFVSKIDPTGSALVYSTYLYGAGDHGVSRIAVDAAGNAHVVGRTDSPYFPIRNAFQPASRGLDDAFITKLNPDGTRLVYSSYLGGSQVGPSSMTGIDAGSAIALDAAGNAHVVGYTLSYDFPTTPDAFQPALADSGPCDDVYGTPCSDAFVARISAAGPGVVPTVSLIATPADTSPGGMVTATWSGLAQGTDCDEIVLNALGSARGDVIANWSTGAAASGTLSVPLPTNLPPGNYELRLLTPVSGAVCYTAVTARSEPFRVAAAAPDLVVTTIAIAPAQPAAGEPVAVTVTVTNQGTVAAGAFAVDFYKDQGAAPGPGAIGDVRCPIASLAPAASAQCTGNVTYGPAGTFSAWAQVDTGQAVAESSEDNNVSGPRAITVVAPARPDLVALSVSNPPAMAAPGSAFAVADTAANAGAGSAAPSTTRFYLSLDTVKDAGDTLLGGSRAVPGLAPDAQSAGTTTVTVPLPAAPGTYRLIACADDTGVVAEVDETNNCLAAAGTVVVGGRDLVETAVSNPPGAARPGTKFSVTDTVRNQGAQTAAASTTRYYLSTGPQKSASDTLLGGSRAVPSLAPGAASTSTVTVTIPAATPPGTYRLLACADDTGTMAETDEANNCLASAGTITVALPDLVQQSVANPSGPVKRGTAFTVSDSVSNDSPVATPRTTTTRYYLSTDGVRSTGDTRLTGSRTVPIQAPGATSSGSKSVTIPKTVLPGTYVVLACADDAKAVAEANEVNNCRASATAIVVTR